MPAVRNKSPGNGGIGRRKGERCGPSEHRAWSFCGGPMAEFLVVAEAEEDDDPGGSGGEPRKRSYGGGAGKTVAPSGEGSGEGETIWRGQVRSRPARYQED